MAAIKLSFQRGSGYKKCIGKYKGSDGKVRPRIFWLGKDKGLAETRAEKLVEEWKAIKAAGGEVWPDGPATPRPTAPPPPVEPASLALVKASLSLHQAMDLYVAQVEAQAPHQIAQSHAARTRQIVRCFNNTFDDRPLSDVGYDFFQHVINHYASRPVTKKGTRMAVETVTRFVADLRCGFLWLEDSGRIELPRRFERLFKIKRAKLLTPQERQQQGAEIETFTIEELQRLYQQANDRQRLYLLMGLFTLSTQRELSVMLKSEFDLTKGELRHYRNKTGVLGVFWLPPELVTLLKSELRKTPDTPEGYAFLTQDSKPLVHYSPKGGKTDAVKLSWDRLCKRAKVKRSFKYLRKHAAKMVKSIAGKDVAAHALSHSNRDNVTEKHYANNRDYPKVIEAQKEMYRQLAPMFQPVEEADGIRSTSVAA